MSVKFQDFYKTLGVDRKADADTIKRAYRKLAAKYHPDRNAGDPRMEEKFKQINEAYEVLKDPEKRKRYDQLGANWKHGQAFNPEDVYSQFGMKGEAFRGAGGAGQGGAAGGGRFNMSGGDFNDFLNSFLGGMAGGFGGGGRDPFSGAAGGMGDFGGAHAQQAGVADTPGEITISMEEAFRGTTRSLAFNRRSPNGPVERQQYDVKVPPGIRDGQKIRLKGQGGSRGSQTGNIIITVHVQPHPKYKLEDANIVATLPLAPWEAALGKLISFMTLDGPVDVKVPAGIRGGQRLRIKGRGFPTSEGRGDFYLRIELVNPPTLSDAERKLMEELAAASDFNPRA